MARRKKFSEQELGRIAREAIMFLTAEGKFHVDISMADITKYAQERYAGYEYSDSRKVVVRKVIEEYRNERGAYLGRANKNAVRAKNFLKTLDKRKFMLDISSNAISVDEAFEKIIEHCNFLLGACQRTERENEKLETQICLLTNQAENHMAEMIGKMNRLEKQNDELETLLDKYKQEVESLNDKAARIVIHDCHMAPVKVDDDNRAKRLTYIDFSEERVRRLEKLKEQYLSEE